MPNYKTSHRPARRRGFDDDNFYGQAPAPSFAGFGGSQAAPEATAKVKWYNPEKGFGFVELTDGSGDVFLHANALRPIGVDAVSPGATLQIRVGQGQKGRQVDQVLSVDESTAEAEPPRRTPGGPQQRAGRPPRRSLDLSRAVEMTGTVKWYNPDKGFGFITGEEGGKDVFVHTSALERSGVSNLQEGQSVRMQVVQGAKGLEVGVILTD